MKCKDCKDRIRPDESNGFKTCHTTCKDYLEYRKKRDEMIKERMKRNILFNGRNKNWFA